LGIKKVNKNSGSFTFVQQKDDRSIVSCIPSRCREESSRVARLATSRCCAVGCKAKVDWTKHCRWTPVLLSLSYLLARHLLSSCLVL